MIWFISDRERRKVMRDSTALSAIRFLQRSSGLCLFLILVLKFISGFSITGSLNLFSTDRAVSIHLAKWVDVPLILFIMIHAANGILKIRLGKGIKHKPRALLIANGIALILFLIAVLFLS
jgi:succinate dehydrogenase/fumarate reductase cytochrome b subunit